ncbi:hypothetical protein AP058_00061 [Flavobacterium sp. TAB 87]|nr:hypothetical protein AP058_00061 [Flavobacterium sp. TAB 87]
MLITSYFMFKADNIIIKIANSIDLEGIVKLQSENQKSKGGTLSSELNINQIEEMMKV